MRAGVRWRPAAAVLAVLAVLAGSVAWYRAHHVRVPLLSAAVGLDGTGALVGVASGAPGVTFYPGTRVVRSGGAGTGDGGGPAAAARQRAWLHATPFSAAASAYGDMARDALLDIDTQIGANGAALAGWPQSWRYVWPRDASFVAAALSRTGHRSDALRVLSFLQSVMPASGVFQARYLPDGSGVPDARGEESDGTGLVLWAVDRLVQDTPAADERLRVLTRLRPLVDTLSAAALRLTADGTRLPPASLDYWEVRDDRLSLGTVAPLAAGLSAAARLYTAVGDRQASERCEAAAGALYGLIRGTFGEQGYPRYLGGAQPDASLAYLLPPFTDSADPAVLEAWRRAATRMRRPAGGLAPGAGWKDDGISWTPETALFALTAASVGDRDRAGGWLDWLAGHRTGYGSLPEKVLSNGAPAGPAPLSFTASLTVLALDALGSAPGSAAP